MGLLDRQGCASDSCAVTRSPECETDRCSHSQRVREALAIAVAMGANTVRFMSCGVSVGSNNPYNLELSNGNWQDVAVSFATLLCSLETGDLLTRDG